jgi:3-hydroxyisobutyryl-CoA hydrolase
MGSGAGISMQAPFTIASDNTDWAMPECSSGLYPDHGASVFFAHLKNDTSLGLYLGLTG